MSREYEEQLMYDFVVDELRLVIVRDPPVQILGLGVVWSSGLHQLLRKGISRHHLVLRTRQRCRGVQMGGIQQIRHIAPVDLKSIHSIISVIAGDRPKR